MREQEGRGGAAGRHLHQDGSRARANHRSSSYRQVAQFVKNWAAPKARGVCPSCAGRRMCNEAAHITDRIT
jgi:hypothetical protein